MKASIFRSISKELSNGNSAELRIAYHDKEYIRRFLHNDRLIILGGGHVGLALSRIAPMLDFSITVVDDRPAFANHERFPDAEKVICDSFENAIRTLDIGKTDYVCVLIGSRRRVAGMKETLLESGYSPERINSLHAPIGLPIGGQTPAEIALSVCAEMIQLKRKDSVKQNDNVLFAKNSDHETLECLAYSDLPRAMLLVLSSDGSTPVESGAMMAVDHTGRAYGTIGGGCSEAAAIAKARTVIGTGERAIIDFDMSNEVAEENGMVCGGSMTVLIEDIEP